MDTYGILGRNISYSLSPVMHNAAFSHFGIDAEYKVFDIEEHDLDLFFTDRVLSGSIKGLNVTVPYKIRIKDAIKEREGAGLDDAAAQLGAVNTVKVEKDLITGYNTDGRGFYESLLEDAGFDPAGKVVVVCGAGGAGRAVSFYLASMDKGPRLLCVFDVDKDRSAGLAGELAKRFGAERCVAAAADEISGKLRECDLAVNATPLGTKEVDPAPFDAGDLKSGAALYDLVYCRETEIVKKAKEKGHVAVNGLGMLVGQGAIAFNIWTSKPIGEVKAVMKKAVQEKIKG